VADSARPPDHQIWPDLSRGSSSSRVPAATNQQLGFSAGCRPSSSHQSITATINHRYCVICFLLM